MVRKAMKTTGLLRRMQALGVGVASLVDFWKSDGHVQLEANCPIWHSGLSSAQPRALSRSQRGAMAAFTGRWATSHTVQLQKLGLERLELRRQTISKRFAQRTASDSRHQELFTPRKDIPRKGKQLIKYREIKTRTDKYYKSALSYLTRLLNTDHWCCRLLRHDFLLSRQVTQICTE